MGQKSNNKEYRGEDRRMDKFFNLSIDLLCIASLDGYFVDINPAFTKTLGHSRKELLATKFVHFVHPEDKEATINEINKLSKGGETFYFENRYRCKDGSYKWLGWTCPKPDPEKNLLYAVARDLTKYKESERALRESENLLVEQKKSLEKKNIALQEVLSQIELEKNQFKKEIVSNIDELLFPLIQKLKRKSSSADMNYLVLLEKNLKSLASSFGFKISDNKLKLTPKEIEICNMIQNGLGSKDIAKLLNISLRTVDNHRNHIRNKLGLAGKRTNLVTYLKSI